MESVSIIKYIKNSSCNFVLIRKNSIFQIFSPNNCCQLDLNHPLGDPNDRTLRTSERKILIPQLMRERARKVKCIPEVKEFEKCAQENGILMPFKCQPQNNKMKECLGYWFYNEDFQKECTDIYLSERSEYRRTGVSKKQRAQAEHYLKEHRRQQEQQQQQQSANST